MARNATPEAGTDARRKSADPPHARALGRALLAWYRHAKRDLPWRDDGDPYRVWVSEIMLQQTRVETVRPYFERWMKRFPTISALASAEEESVLSAWQGLGYYSRARNLQRTARVAVERHASRLPDNTEELEALPGIGPYSAGAIASIAFGKRVPIVDGNVVRVLSRLFALRGDPAKQPVKGQLWSLAASLVPKDAPGDFNQGLMELGATVCTPRRPLCDTCPVLALCAARKAGLENRLPELPKRPAPVAEHRVLAVLRRRDEVLLLKTPDAAPRWRGLWQFPNVVHGQAPSARDAKGRAAKPQAREPRAAKPRDVATALAHYLKATLGLDVQVGALLLTQKHSITKYRVTLDAYACVPGRGRAPAPPEARWVPIDELEELPLPAPHRRIARAL